MCSVSNTLISLTILVLLVAYSIFHEDHNFKLAYPEAGYTIEELAHSLGLEFERHNLITRDKYILQLHRIPCRRKHKNVSSTSCQPIFLQHGLLCSSIFFLLIGSKSIAYLLANSGYDVWLGNARGNYFSRKHIALDPYADAKQFYNFSLHEIATIDLPNTIDYILNVTEQRKLFYLGHSQGAILFHIMMSEMPEYNRKIQLMIAFAPVVYVAGVLSPAIRIPALFQHVLEAASEIIGLHELLPRRLFWRKFSNSFCYDGSWTQQYCHLHLSIIGGFNNQQMNKTLLPLIISHIPAGASIKQLLHYAQILNTDVLQQYAPDAESNLVSKGHLPPRTYSLHHTTIPVAIFYGSNDYFTNQRNIDLLANQLPNVILKQRVPDALFTHFDFALANNAINSLYPQVLSLLDKYRF